MKKLFLIILLFVSVISFGQIPNARLRPCFVADYAASAVLPASTYANGSAGGIGATITGSSNGALASQDGQTSTVNDVILIWQEATTSRNGIYKLTQVGTGGTPFILTRMAGADYPRALDAGNAVYITNGTTYGKHYFNAMTASPITIGTTAIVYQISALLPSANFSDIGNASTAVSNLGIVAINPVAIAQEATSVNPGFVVLASAIARVSNTLNIHSGQPLVWTLVQDANGHGPLLYDSITPSPFNAKRMTIWNPPAKTIFDVVIGDDESGSLQSVTIGPTVAEYYAEFNAGKPMMQVTSMVGDGACNWTIDASTYALTKSTFSTSDGGTSFTADTFQILNNYKSVPITYVGPNGYTIDRTYSGLGSYNAKFYLVTPGGGYLGTCPTTLDRVIIGPISMGSVQMNLSTWDNTNNWMNTFTNWWITGKYEMWMVCNTLSSTSLQVKWQTLYPSGTGYKIYRSVTKWGTYSLVASSGTGSSSAFTDTGLTPNTLYWYHYVVTIAGVDTEISQFPGATTF